MTLELSRFRGLIFGATILLSMSIAVAQAQNVSSPSGAELREVRGTSSTSTNSARPSAPVQNVGPYTIGPGDVLSINVYNEPEVTGKVPVRPDGVISVPLIGDIQASGQTPDRLQNTITQKLTEYVKEPSVTVVVEEMNSRQYNVLGQVQHPGSFPLARPTRVLDALAQAGGLGEFAKTSKIYVLRRDSTGATIKLPFDYKRVSQGRDVGANNVELQPGDTVIVP